MTAGLSATNYANKILDHMHRGVASTAPAGNFVKLHTGDPGASGASNASSVTTRPAVTFAAASAGSVSMNGTPPSWTNWAGTNGEVVSHISIHDANTAGNFLASSALTANKTVNTGDTLSMASLTVAYAPIAA